MMHLAGGINPDSNICVAAVFPNGSVTVFETLKKNQTVRKVAYRTTFANYGKAKLWADEFEETNRKMRAKEAE